MERTVADQDQDHLGFSFGPNKLKPPSSINFPFSTADQTIYSDAAAIFWKNSSSASVGVRMFPFTTPQWQELQRQALIYKHIMASVPVPQDLLLTSAARAFPESPSIFLPPSPTMYVGRGGGVSLRFSSSTDPEPGRCRRTDGKKWRCARDAAPDQKYCERHLHRGRPRSRKPVEQRKPRSSSSSKSSLAVAAAATEESYNNGTNHSSGGLELNLPFKSVESNEEPRCQEWMRSYSENLTSSKRWETMHSKIGSRYDTSPDTQHYEELPNLNYTDTNNHWFSFLNPSISSLDETTDGDYSETPRRFIDAWSSENVPTVTTSNPDNSLFSGRDNKLKRPLSTLTLSMSNVTETESGNCSKSPRNWMGSNNSPLGGPLAEVLQSSNRTPSHNSSDQLINLMTKSGGQSHEASPQESPSRLVSSPSGVLNKALVSLSDSSSSNSPTFAAAPRSDFAFQWMNLNK